jgi:hypothetical protein
MAVRGDSPIMIQWAGGHTDFKTTQGYIARGQTERRRIGEPLPALPRGLQEAPTGLGFVSDSSETHRANFPFSLGNMVTPTGIENRIDRTKQRESLRIEGVAGSAPVLRPPPKPADPRRSEIRDCGPDAAIHLVRARELVTAAASLVAPGGPCAVLLAEALAILEPLVSGKVVPLFRRRR